MTALQHRSEPMTLTEADPQDRSTMPSEGDTDADHRSGDDLRSELAEAQSALAQTRLALEAVERRRALERAVADQGAIDLDAAVLLAEPLLAAAAGGQRSPVEAAAELRRTRPLLFRPPPARRTSAMAGEVERAPALDEAALRARETGDRRALLRYLRLRRGT
jgi:hypothetical protein